MTLNPGLTLTQTHTQSANEMQRPEHKKKKKKKSFPTHKQTLACVHTERYLNHPSPVQCYNRTMMVTGRAC